MKDTIYREDAIKAIEEMLILDDPRHLNDLEFGHNAGLNHAVSVLEDLPSADRPQGKWKVKSFHECFCNNCGFSFDIMKCEFLENMKYCPNCGVPKGADDE